MKDFLTRVLLGLLTGWIIVFYGELVFWATPEREGMDLGGILAVWLVYSLLSSIFLCVVRVFRVRSAAAVFLAGAFYGWLEEGVFVQTMYGSEDGPFPVSIAFTGLAWHALLDVFVGWYLVRKALGEPRPLRAIGLTSAIGLFYGLWAIWWWNEPPGPMKALLEAGRKDLLFLRFAAFSFASTGVLVLAHKLYNKVMPFTFTPSRGEFWGLGGATVLYFALVTVPAAPRALWVLPLLWGITFWALNRNRQTETEPDAICGLGSAVSVGRYLTLFLIPLIASGIYVLALAGDLRLSTNKVVYVLSSALGTLGWLVSVILVARRR